ncbi:PASTA domain-containing protein [Yeguia hominis]|uniref:PASTA domain-containing protein n=1 Tax=Yeguia hominis TaxID=2763662 RepID=A0A926D8K1_9FIRM|nr:PASTA domain-containing protein [Yeguia hominis]MBC8533216.1 PASTA domain-containing protein [Yeguia hominis]
MANIEHLCMSCMNDMGDHPVCPRCGYHPDADRQMPEALPYRTILQNRYLVGRGMFRNGEGITYIGFDLVLSAPVQLRELYPQNFCLRTADGKSVAPIAGKEIPFDECMAAFLSYARRVAHMRELSAIEQIYDIFEENQTAYTVSEWAESISLRYFVERSGGSLHWNAARQLFMPVLSALSAMYEGGVGHYGISPATLSILPDGKMRLGGFAIESIRRVGSGMVPDLVPGCAALEQYDADAAFDEATDVYGFAASLFFALTGVLPQDALKRKTDSRLMIPTATLRSIPPHVVTALANALQISRENRTQTFERLRAELSAAPTVTASIEETQTIRKIVAPYQPPVPQTEKKQENTSKLPDSVWILVSCLATVAVLGLIVYLWVSIRGTNPEEGDASSAMSSVVSELEVSSGLSSEESSVPEDAILVPDLRSQNYEDLLAELEQKTDPDYEILLGEKEFDDTVEEGAILSQSPEAGEGKYMQKGESIVVTVSRGPAQRELPYVEGNSLASASETLSGLGFIPRKVDVYSDSYAVGYVVGYQNASPGESLPYGSQVVLEVSMGPDPDA